MSPSPHGDYPEPPKTSEFFKRFLACVALIAMCLSIGLYIYPDTPTLTVIKDGIDIVTIDGNNFTCQKVIESDGNIKGHHCIDKNLRGPVKKLITIPKTNVSHTIINYNWGEESKNAKIHN